MVVEAGTPVFRAAEDLIERGADWRRRLVGGHASTFEDSMRSTTSGAARGVDRRPR